MEQADHFAGHGTQPQALAVAEIRPVAAVWLVLVDARRPLAGDVDVRRDGRCAPKQAVLFAFYSLRDVD